MCLKSIFTYTKQQAYNLYPQPIKVKRKVVVFFPTYRAAKKITPENNGLLHLIYLTTFQKHGLVNDKNKEKNEKTSYIKSRQMERRKKVKFSLPFIPTGFPIICV